MSQIFSGSVRLTESDRYKPRKGLSQPSKTISTDKLSCFIHFSGREMSQMSPGCLELSNLIT